MGTGLAVPSMMSPTAATSALGRRKRRSLRAAWRLHTPEPVSDPDVPKRPPPPPPGPDVIPPDIDDPTPLDRPTPVREPRNPPPPAIARHG
jgi:hypothetical protein